MKLFKKLFIFFPLIFCNNELDLIKDILLFNIYKSNDEEQLLMISLNGPLNLLFGYLYHKTNMVYKKLAISPENDIKYLLKFNNNFKGNLENRPDYNKSNIYEFVGYNSVETKYIIAYNQILRLLFKIKDDGTVDLITCENSFYDFLEFFHAKYHIDELFAALFLFVEGVNVNLFISHDENYLILNEKNVNFKIPLVSKNKNYVYVVKTILNIFKKEFSKWSDIIIADRKNIYENNINTIGLEIQSPKFILHSYIYAILAKNFMIFRNLGIKYFQILKNHSESNENSESNKKINNILNNSFVIIKNKINSSYINFIKSIFLKLKVIENNDIFLKRNKIFDCNKKSKLVKIISSIKKNDNQIIKLYPEKFYDNEVEMNIFYFLGICFYDNISKLFNVSHLNNLLPSFMSFFKENYCPFSIKYDYYFHKIIGDMFSNLYCKNIKYEKSFANFKNNLGYIILYKIYDSFENFLRVVCFICGLNEISNKLDIYSKKVYLTKDEILDICQEIIKKLCYNNDICKEIISKFSEDIKETYPTDVINIKNDVFPIKFDTYIKELIYNGHKNDIFMKTSKKIDYFSGIFFDMFNKFVDMKNDSEKIEDIFYNNILMPYNNNIFRLSILENFNALLFMINSKNICMLLQILFCVEILEYHKDFVKILNLQNFDLSNDSFKKILLFFNNSLNFLSDNQIKYVNNLISNIIISIYYNDISKMNEYIQPIFQFYLKCINLKYIELPDLGYSIIRIFPNIFLINLNSDLMKFIYLLNYIKMRIINTNINYTNLIIKLYRLFYEYFSYHINILDIGFYILSIINKNTDLIDFNYMFFNFINIYYNFSFKFCDNKKVMNLINKYSIYFKNLEIVETSNSFLVRLFDNYSQKTILNFLNLFATNNMSSYYEYILKKKFFLFDKTKINIRTFKINYTSIYEKCSTISSESYEYIICNILNHIIDSNGFDLIYDIFWSYYEKLFIDETLALFISDISEKFTTLFQLFSYVDEKNINFISLLNLYIVYEYINSYINCLKRILIYLFLNNYVSENQSNLQKLVDHYNEKKDNLYQLIINESKNI